MKILFVHKEEDPIDPMQIELLSAMAKNEGHETFLNILQHRNLADDLRKIQPELVAFTGKTGEHTTLLKANKYIKETYGDSIKTIMGGPHCTFNHAGMQLYGETDDEFADYRERFSQTQMLRTSGNKQRHTIAEKTDLDILCFGEGDDAWVEMLRAMSHNESIDDIPNLITRTNRYKYDQPQFREMRRALDDLPYYDRELVYDKTFLSDFPMRSFMSSRGCPYRCTYCFNFDYNKTYSSAGLMTKMHKRYSVDRLIAEVHHWMEVEAKRGYTRTQFIKFYDDMFEFRVTPWLEEFAEKFPKEVGIPFSCLVRCDIFANQQPDGSMKENEDILLLLKKAGMQSINMSIESGNNFIRENILVRDMTGKEINTAFNMMKRHGIGTFANTILGIPAPVIPRRETADFDKKLHQTCEEIKTAFVVAKKQAGGTRGMKYPEQLDGVMEAIEKGTITEEVRERTLQLLESMELRYDAIDYDIEGVELTINLGVHENLFPRLEPYPGTVVTDFTMAIGAFDGDFQKLHSSCLSTSAFSCYTDEQRRVQDNLSFLGQVCAVFPWLWPVAKKHLIYWPLTRFYWMLFVITKTWNVKKYVYPMKFSFKTFCISAYRVIMFELKQFFNFKKEENFYKKPKGYLAAASPTDQLGGRWEA